MNKQSEKALRTTIETEKLKIKAHKDILKDAEQALAELLCPFEIGDIVVNPSTNNGQMSRARVVGIYPHWAAIHPYQLRLRGIKKDGSDYTNTSDARRVMKWVAESDK